MDHRNVIAHDHVYVIAVGFAPPDVAKPVYEIKFKRSAVPDAVVAIQNDIVRIKLVCIVRIEDNLAVLVRVRKVSQQDFLVRVRRTAENAEPVV